MFDPYKKWLGIPTKDQPPNHYRLLGLELYESDLDVIDRAADRMMGFLRQYQSGENAADAAKLLNEVASTRLCLLKPDTKAEYDAKLRKTLDASKPEVVTEEDLANLSLPVTFDREPAVLRQPPKSKRGKKGRRASNPPWIPLGVGAVVIVLVVALMLGPRATNQFDRAVESPNAASAVYQSTRAPDAGLTQQPSPIATPSSTIQPPAKQPQTNSTSDSPTSEQKTEIADVKIPTASTKSPKQSTSDDPKSSPKERGTASPQLDPPILHSGYVIEDGKWGPHDFCQGVSLAETPKGIVAAFIGGSAAEGTHDRGIWISHRSDDLGWTAPVEIASNSLDRKFDKRLDIPNIPAGPVLFASDSSRLDLYYRVRYSQTKCIGVVKTSTDQGVTWSKPTILPEGFNGPTRPSPHRLANNTILFATESESNNGKIHFEFFDGKRWTKTPEINDGQSIKIFGPTLLDHGKNHWQAMGRSDREHGKIFQTWSNDGGKTWSEVTFLDLPNPSSPVDVIKLNDGRFLMVYNHSSTNRTPFNMALSEDGIHWQAALVLESDDQETSHPSLVQTPDGLVHLAYPRAKKSLRYLIIDPQKLRLQPIVGGVWPTAE